MNKFKEPNSPYMTVDTGINIGYAIFSPESHSPIKTDIKSIKTDLPWTVRSQAILYSWKTTMMNYHPRNLKQIYLEEPQFFDSHSGITAARTKNLFKLIYMYSCTHYIARSMGFEVISLPVNWKGQMDKKMVDQRIDAILGEKYPEHISDAVGMGLFLKGLL